MTQNITIQIGQCGNQIGCRFWDLALREHLAINKKGIFDEALGSFFLNTDNYGHEILPSKAHTNKSIPIQQLKARAVLVDTEEGVVNEIMKKSALKDLFDHRQFVTDVSGAGNNWAVGHVYYGQKYVPEIRELVRKSAEACDSLETFFLIHSMGGGTGSGLGWV
jgi:tubulin epsilon